MCRLVTLFSLSILYAPPVGLAPALDVGTHARSSMGVCRLHTLRTYSDPYLSESPQILVSFRNYYQISASINIAENGPHYVDQFCGQHSCPPHLPASAVSLLFESSSSILKRLSFSQVLICCLIISVELLSILTV